MGKGSTSRRRRERNPDKAWKKVQCLRHLKELRAYAHEHGYVDWSAVNVKTKQTKERKMTFYDQETHKRDDELVDKVFDNLINVTDIMFDDPEREKTIKKGYKTGDMIAIFLLNAYWMNIEAQPSE